MADANGRVLGLEGVSFRRGDAQVLAGIDWCVHAGEQWAVLGPNGAGKTTLVMIATGYVPSSSGRVYLLEGYISSIILPRVRERVGLVSGALTDAMLKHRGSTTGLEVVLSGRYASLGYYQRPTPEELDRARAVIDHLGIGHLAEKTFALMSTGERQICLIARCHMAHSEVVILDEPCAGLDIAARERLLAGLERACRDEPHVPQVLVTHHPEEIMPGVTHVLLVRGGGVVAQGPKADVLTEANLTATFDLPVQVIQKDDRIWIVPRGVI